MELAIYCMSRCVESFCLCLREWGWVSDRMVPPRLDILMFMGACGAIMHCYSDARGKYRSMFRSKYLNVLDFILGSKGGSLSSCLNLPESSSFNGPNPLQQSLYFDNRIDASDAVSAAACLHGGRQCIFSVAHAFAGSAAGSYGA